MQTQTLPEFKGTQIIPKEIQFPEADCLQGDFGKYVHNEVISEYGSDNSFVTTKIIYDDEAQVVKGSKPGYIVAANKIIRNQGLTTVTQADLENILENKILDLKGFYEDTALVLRSKQNPNQYLANHLAKQVEHRKGKNFRSPVMISLCDLDLVKDNNSPYKLSFKLRESSNIIYTPILNKSGNFSSKDIIKKTGLPKKTGKQGDRTLYTRDSGLSRLYLGRDLGLGSNWGGLAGSDAGGRVVVLNKNSEAGSQKILGYEEETNKLRKEYVSQLKNIRDKINLELQNN